MEEEGGKEEGKEEEGDDKPKELSDSTPLDLPFP